ncbi:hypothetical protein MSAN_01513100 [Mycena sanguinolenta]|uniref:Uncharacterized protein n=1 Tax=Mycena sanguinolenta TaxID=230812 RepID=A0A8H6Y5Y8_9AGAR|nr:hypothetical protein MSAN_01513100 [Mycena sanguinolenta]
MNPASCFLPRRRRSSLAKLPSDPTTTKLVMSAAQTLWYLGWDGLMTTNLNILLNRRKEIEAEAGHGEAGEYPIWVSEDFEGINKYLAWCPSFADFFECRSGGRGFTPSGPIFWAVDGSLFIYGELVGCAALLENHAARARVRLIMHTDDIEGYNDDAFLLELENRNQAVLEACGLYDDEEFEDDEDEDD